MHILSIPRYTADILITNTCNTFRLYYFYSNVGTPAFKLQCMIFFGICSLFCYSDSCWVVGINCSNLICLLLNLTVKQSRVTFRVLLRLKGLTAIPPLLPVCTSNWRTDQIRYFVTTCVRLSGGQLPFPFHVSVTDSKRGQTIKRAPTALTRVSQTTVRGAHPFYHVVSLPSPLFYLGLSVLPVISTHISIGHWSSRCVSEIRLSGHSYQPPQPP